MCSRRRRYGRRKACYVVRIRIQKRGLYRIYTAFNGDSKNLSVASAGMFVRVGSTTEAAPAPGAGGTSAKR